MAGILLNPISTFTQQPAPSPSPAAATNVTQPTEEQLRISFQTELEAYGRTHTAAEVRQYAQARANQMSADALGIPTLTMILNLGGDRDGTREPRRGIWTRNGAVSVPRSISRSV
jgi:hypothetical protein